MNADVGRCDNCGAALQGPFCHACGQGAIDDDELTVRHAVQTAASDVLHLESKTLRSIAQLAKPGALTDAYLEGHRVRYTSPLKLYLACAAVFFLCAPFAGFTLEKILSQDSGGQLTEFVSKQVAAKGIDRALFAERFDIRFQSVYTVSLAGSVLTGALILSLLFRRQRRPFGAHVVFELHYVSFLYLLAIGLGVVLQLAPLHPLAGLLLTVGVTLPYMFAALRRVYKEPAGRILWKTLVMVLSAMFVDNTINFLTLVITVALI